jgi:hypothetical protein
VLYKLYFDLVRSVRVCLLSTYITHILVVIKRWAVFDETRVTCRDHGWGGGGEKCEHNVGLKA